MLHLCNRPWIKLLFPTTSTEWTLRGKNYSLRNTYKIFIIKGFRTIVIIFIVIFTTFRLIGPPTFFRCLSNSTTFTELRTTSFIESTEVACSDSVWRIHGLSNPVLLLACSQDWTYKWLSPLKLKEPTPITVTPCVLLDNSEWIFGTYKLNVLTWLELLQLCMIFYPCSCSHFFFFWQTEQTTPVDSITDVVRSSVKVPEFYKHLKKARGHIGRNVMEITIKMKKIVRKPLMIKIKLRLRNLDN